MSEKKVLLFTTFGEETRWGKALNNPPWKAHRGPNEGVCSHKPSVISFIPYFAELPAFNDFFHIPTPPFGLMFIKESVEHPIDVLGYPTREEYIEALEKGYDIVGISFLSFKTSEALEMARIAREYGVRELWPGLRGGYTRRHRGAIRQDI